MNESARDKLLAHYYDLEYRDYADDLDFYVQHAYSLDPDQTLPVLELGCGTGRIALALAEAGFSVGAVDSSEGMLALCAEHASEQGLDHRVTLYRADMRDLSALQGTRYNMAFCALNTFAYLADTTDQLAMLRSVHLLLVQHGLLVLDLTPPMKHLLPPSDGETLHHGSFTDEAATTLHKFVSGYAEPSRQRHHVAMFYDLEGADGTLQRITQQVTFRWTGRYEM